MSKLAINDGQSVRSEPFETWPQYTEQEAQTAADVVRGGSLCAHHGGDEHVEGFEEAFGDYCGADYAIGTSSGTTALHVALTAADIGPGDEVVVPPFTFRATATSVVMANAVPVFADIEPHSLGLDPESVRSQITPRTEAIIAVHLYGFPARMEDLTKIAEEHDLTLIEDCAHAHGAEYRGKKAGTLGDMGCFSFQQKKILSIGDGGMITTDDADLAHQAAGLRSFSDLPISFNMRMTEIHAAIGKLRLERLDEQNEKRRENAAYLDERIANLPALTPQQPQPRTTPVYYNYVVRYDAEEFGVGRDTFHEALEAEGLPAGSQYLPLQRHNTFQTRDAFGHGCPFECPYYTQETPPEKQPKYDEAKTPVAVDMHDNEVISFTIHPPNDRAEMKDIGDIFEKVITHIDELR